MPAEQNKWIHVDLVLTGGAVYTLDAARSWAEAVAVRDGRITFVGTDADAAAWIGPSTRVVRLGGRILLPSFQDPHVHPVTGGVELGQCNLNGLATRQAILDQVKACARQQADRSWLLGGGWALHAFPGGAPTRQELDAIVADKPALLYAADGHSSWANSRALALARIDATTPDPKDGRIERDPKTGLPTGTLRESASALVGAGAAPSELRATARASLARRKATQPLDARTAGCIFRNPDPAQEPVPAGVPASAGALIDRAGLKGRRIGGASVSTTHANFIVNDGGARAADIRALVRLCQHEGFQRFGVRLREEIVYVGRFEP